MKVYLETLGCKLNESELEMWTHKFAAEGNEVVSQPSDADICVLNTCTVTAQAARKSRNLARQLSRANPNARLVLTGCYASIEPSQARALPNVALVVPNAEKDNLVQMANGILPTPALQPTQCGASVADCTTSAISHQPSAISHTRTRAFVKIQDGCNMSCTYCIIPLARGKERSRPMAEIVAEVRSLVDSGYKEIILTGVQISEYRHSVFASPTGAKQSPFRQLEIASSQNARLAMTLKDLVAAILSETKVPRLRLTSIAPWDLDEALLDLFSDPRLCRHLHLSLQSGSDTVLKRMRRPYTTEQFARAVAITQARVPDVAITTDVIVGFPGESDHEFEESLRFVERMQFARVHVFPYSARGGTIAAGLPHPVSDKIKDIRAKRMQEVAEIASGRFASRFVGRTMEVLWENAEQGSEEEGRWSGYTDNYVRVVTSSKFKMQNRIAPARLIQAIGDRSIAATLQGGFSC